MTGRSAQRLEESKCHSYLQGGQEGRLRKLQAAQPHLSPWESDRANQSGNHFHTHEGQEGDQEYSAWIYKEEIMLN